MQPPQAPRNQTPQGYYLRAKSSWILVLMFYFAAGSAAVLVSIPDENFLLGLITFILVAFSGHWSRSRLVKEHDEFTINARAYRSYLNQQYQATLINLTRDPYNQSNYFQAQQAGTALHKFTAKYPQVEYFELKTIERDTTFALAQAK